MAAVHLGQNNERGEDLVVPVSRNEATSKVIIQTIVRTTKSDDLHPNCRSRVLGGGHTQISAQANRKVLTCGFWMVEIRYPTPWHKPLGMLTPEKWMPLTHTTLSQCKMMYATWHLAGGVFIDLKMGMGCCANFMVVHHLYLSPHCELDATIEWLTFVAWWLLSCTLHRKERSKPKEHVAKTNMNHNVCRRESGELQLVPVFSPSGR